VRSLLALLLLLIPVRGLAAEADNAAFAFDTRLGAQLPPDAALRDEQGRTVTLGTIMGGAPLVLALGYFHCPNICGVVRDDVLSGLERAGLRAGTDYRLLVLSIDPEETPADAARAKEGALSRYPDPGAESAWRFLTAPAPGIAAIATAAGFRSRFDPALKQFLHPAGVVIASPAGIISSYLLGVGYQPSDVRSAVLRANRGAVATAISPVLLLCFHFDPKTGTYDFAVYRALSVLAALTLVTLGGLFLLLQRRDRRRA
jgi:protein SCO1/2